ncbi:hypothetical protein L7F22_063274 [Adiantum nelumboides]|nr:hypothetical protein [Adiantum nelumboides]
MAAILHPFYKTPELFGDIPLLTLRSQYLNLMLSEDDQLVIDGDMSSFMNNLGPTYLRSVATRSEATRFPLSWWQNYGRQGLPQLCKLTLRVLSQMMDRIFREYRLFVGTFFDDIIVFSKNEAEHRDHLLQVFQALRHQKLVINAKKSVFFLPEIHFLGHIVSTARKQMDPAKIEAIRNWPDLKNVHEVRSFLGLCSYYRRYVRKFAEIASPLYMLTQKGVSFSCGATEVTAFQTLKDKMTTRPVLILPDLQKSFEIYCDACVRSLGAVFMQEGRVIAYESRLFSKPEMTAQIYEKEKNVVADALSRKPLVQAISAIHHSSFEDMVDQYATDTDFANISLGYEMGR